MPDHIHASLVLQEAIKFYSDEIVTAATQTALLLHGNDQMQKNQIRNVLNVAEESQSVAVVANFIRYQIGRNNAWQRKGVGLQIIADVSQPDGVVDRVVKKVLQRVADRLGQEAVTDELRRQAHLTLMESYLGYLNRAFVFGSNKDMKISGWQELERALEQPGKEG